MRNIKILALCVLLGICALSGCGRVGAPLADDGRIQIVCTAFPQYDWTRNLIRGNEENISLMLLMDKGGDLHNFQPSALDIARVSGCDLFIYVGGESDAWVDDAVVEAVNSDMSVINMMETVGENLVAEEDLANHEGHGAHEHGSEYDEHIWLSLRNSGVVVKAIAEELSELDLENAVLYGRNCENYLSKLKALDSEYEKAVSESGGDTLLFADRFPFRYLIEDYGLKYYAAFEGCSAETEASFETVAFLVNKLDETGLGCVSVLDGSGDRLARVVIENSRAKNQKIIVLDSLQSVSRQDINAGRSYLSAMSDNLATLKEALRGD